jgi:hypothetical protein
MVFKLLAFLFPFCFLTLHWLMVYSNAHLLWSQEFKLAVGFKEMIWMAAADLCWYLLKAG